MSSKMPDGGFILTDGSNYGLDGFQFDTEYNGGVLEGARLPEAKGLAGLPDGIVKGSSTEIEEGGGLDLSSLVPDKVATPLMDHYWLETAEQDPERLPHNPSDLAIPELEEAWGVNRRTDGINIIPNIQKYDTPPPSELSELPGDDFRYVVKKAMRMATFGKPLDQIKDYLSLSVKGTSYAKVAALIEADYGLAGNVFIRAAAFPGIQSGKWETKLRKMSAKYIISDDKTIDLHKLHGKKVVASIPWREAYNEYKPLLKGSGRKVSSKGSYESRLRSSFLNERKAKKRTSMRQAYDLKSRRVEKPEEVFEHPQVIKAVRWVKAQMNEGFIGRDLDDLISLKFSPDILKAASSSFDRVRKSHEGLAGQVYIDASAYATDSGVNGCEEGSLRHRSNPVKAILKMDKCSSCVFNTEGSCQKYMKRVASIEELGNTHKYQKEALRLANATDAEVTASLFSPSEFNLGNSNLNDFEYSEMPSNESLSGISFGGIYMDES